jgi:hypothetical protein
MSYAIAAAPLPPAKFSLNVYHTFCYCDCIFSCIYNIVEVVIHTAVNSLFTYNNWHIYYNSTDAIITIDWFDKYIYSFCYRAPPTSEPGEELFAAAGLPRRGGCASEGE